MVTVENTWKEIEESGADIVIIPIGAIEQHGPHLPVGTDWFMADVWAKCVGEKLNAYVLPALPISNSQEHLDFKGSVSIRPCTLAQVVEEIILSLRHQGFKKFVVMSAHGGNWVLKPAIRDINFRYPDIMVIMGSGTMPGDTKAIPPDIHSGEGETGRMLAFKPELVKGRADDFTPRYGREYIDYVSLRKLTPTGVWGKPSKASAEKAKEASEATAERCAEYIKTTFAELEKLKNNASG